MQEQATLQTLQETEIISSHIAVALQKKHSFCLWKTPGADEKFLITSAQVFEETEVTLEGGTKGFVFAPFLPIEPKTIFPADTILHFQNGHLVEGNVVSEVRSFTTTDLYTSTPKNNPTLGYTQLVEQSLAQIESGQLEKIVPSRYSDFSYSPRVNVLQIFNQLCENHPQALVSFVSSPQTGTWIGATPELLVSVANNKFKTVALAGTLPYSPAVNLKNVAWTQKEIEEQALVCRYIINCFKKIRLREYEEHGPRTTVAGNVMHLKTDYEVDMEATNFPQLGSVMLKLLHPTSAVCGMPLAPALDFLQTMEGYDREFYSGYLGPININATSTVFVNLRCAQLFADRVRIYAGAGVTQDSDAAEEFRETEVKMENLKKLFTV
ncbi:MAG: chorismate-binding protein [Cytophagales bacterium]|nr:chorismate-binding protein [Cytophagales bacterium]